MSEINIILDFWFGEIRDGFTIEDRNGFWFMPNESVDKTIKGKFGDLVTEAGSGKLKKWGSSPRGCLALIILLDQFTRNIYRGSAEAFQYDNDARRICKHGIKDGTDKKLEIIERCFYYLPLEHTENIEDQQLCLELLKKILGSNIEKHRDKIEDEIYSLKSGDFFTIPQNTVHSVTVTSKNPMKIISSQTPEFFGKDRIFED